MLLGLLREGEGVGAAVLVMLGVDLSDARLRVLELLHVDPAPPGQPVLLERQPPPQCPRCQSSLAQKAAYRMVTVANEDGQDPINVPIVYCVTCGAAIGVARPDL